MLFACQVGVIYNIILLAAPTLSASAEDDDLALNYMKMYTTIEEQPKTGASSSGGNHGNGGVKITPQSPSFMEMVATIQRSYGFTPTGVLDDEVIKMMKKPRCGMADEPSSGNAPASYTAHSKWRTSNPVTGNYELSYSFFPNTYPSQVRTEDVRRGVLAAMCVWEMNSKIRFNIELQNGDEDANIRIKFGESDHGDGFDFDGRGGTLAHAFYPENGRLHFDSAEEWFLALTDEPDSRRDIFTVAAHELGHSLGLAHSNVRGALMAPIYDFQGPFKDYRLPLDDLEGIVSLYGHSTSDASRDSYSACSNLKQMYSQTPQRPNERPNPPRRPITTTTTPRRSRRPRPQLPSAACEDVKTEYTCSFLSEQGLCSDPSYEAQMKKSCAKTCNFCTGCDDDPELKRNCRGWRQAGYCTDSAQGPTMSRVCKKTCGFCRNTRDAKPTDPPIPAESVCDIRSFDSFITTYDSPTAFQAYAFKGNSYFPLQFRVDHRSLSLLDDDMPNHQIIWDYDPTKVSPGVFVLGTTGPFYRTESVSAVIWADSFYIVINNVSINGRGKLEVFSYTTSFAPPATKTSHSTLHVMKLLQSAVLLELLGMHITAETTCKSENTWKVLYKITENGFVDEYQRNSPKRKMLGSMSIRDMFAGFPYTEVDAGFAEWVGGKRKVLLFKGSLFWTFEADNPRDDQMHQFRMTSFGRDIAEWHGVPACDVDAVIEYKDKPYFLKGNAIWAANASEPQTYKDITYNFFRCWSTPPTSVTVDRSCNKAWKLQFNYLLFLSAFFLALPSTLL